VIGVAARGSTILAATFEEQAPTITQVGTSGPAYGLYRSTNGGQTFSVVTNGLPPGPVTALVADKTNPNTFYASVTSPTNPSAAGVYVSNNAGQSWNPVFTSATAVAGGANIITGATSQLVPKLATGPNGSVAVAIADVSTGQLSGLYLSQNSGTSWSYLTAPPVNAGSKQAVVNLAVAIDLNNTSTVYVTGDCCTSNTTLPTYSVAPGQAPVSLTSASSSAHADSRTLVLDVNDNLLVGSDGGIYRLTSPLTNSGVWQGFNTSTLQIREPYAVAYGAYANRFVVAAQDTGGAIQSDPNNVLYKAIQAADGVNAVAADRTLSNGTGGTVNASVYYTSIYNLDGLKRLTIDGSGNSMTADVKCNGQECGCNPGSQTTCSAGFVFNNFFNSPFVINRADPSRVAMAGSNVYVAQDTAAANAATVNLATTDLGFTGQYIQTIAYGTIDNPNVVLAGSGFSGSNGQLFLSTTASAGSMKADSAPIRGSTPLRWCSISALRSGFMSRTVSIFGGPRTRGKYHRTHVELADKYNTADVGGVYQQQWCQCIVGRRPHYRCQRPEPDCGRRQRQQWQPAELAIVRLGATECAGLADVV
jgi:hypothetical protein